MQYYLFPLYIFLGMLPSLLWLFYYLRKDLHPEPKRMILKIFLLGGVITVPVFFIQVGLLRLLNVFDGMAFFAWHPAIVPILTWFVIIAFTEELAKYAVVKWGIFNNSALDEPLDVMLYMVVAALGFAAVENILYLSSYLAGLRSLDSMIGVALLVLGIRFIGATFLHTLCSALAGYFLAMASFQAKKKVLLGMGGLAAAVVLHGLYDFSMITFPLPFNVAIPMAVVLALALFMIYDFNEIKKIKSICKL